MSGQEGGTLGHQRSWTSPLLGSAMALLAAPKHLVPSSSLRLQLLSSSLICLIYKEHQLSHIKNMRRRLLPFDFQI